MMNEEVDVEAVSKASLEVEAHTFPEEGLLDNDSAGAKKLEEQLEHGLVANYTTEEENSSVESPESEEEVSEEENRRLKRNRRIKAAVGLFLLAFVAFVVTDSLTNSYLKSGMTSFLEWVEDNPGGGVIAFVIVIFFTTMLFIPGIILTFGSGYVFANSFGLGVGVLLGSVAVFIGASAGAMVSFLLGRFLLRDCVSGLTKRFKLLEAVDSAMEEKGLRIMLLLRLSPIIYASPYLNYGSGGMAISFWAYSVALFAILPSTVMFVFLGASAGSLADSSGGGDSTTTTVVLVVGIVFSVFAIGLTTFYAKQELQKVTSASQEANAHNDMELVENAVEEEAETSSLVRL